MAETTRHGTYSITNDREAWLKQQKKETGLPESHFVNKGLDLVMGTEEINAIRLMITPALSSFLCLILFAFAFCYSDVLPVPIMLIMFLCSFVIIIISWFGLYKSLKVWRKVRGMK